MNLLGLIQQVYNELGGLNTNGVPTAVVSSQDPTVKQMYALISRQGHDLARQFDWQALNKEYIIQTVATTKSVTLVQGSYQATMASTAGLSANYGIDGSGVNPFTSVVSVDSGTQITMNMPALSSGVFTLNFAQTNYPLPSDWLKQIPQTEWDRTNRWPLMGPKSPQEWQSYKSGIVYAGPRERFRILGGAVTISPPPPNGLLFAYEYISSAWVIDASGTRKQTYSADTDTCVFDDSLMVSGLKMRFKQAKGLDFTAEAAEYGQLLNALKAQDKSAPKLSLSPFYGNPLLGYENIPDGSWGTI